MKFLPLVWKNLWRRKFRTIFTLLSIFIAFLLFGILMTIRTAFSFGVEIAGLDRLVLIHKVSLIMPLPVSLPGAAAVATEGVALATHKTWFGGIYQDPANFFAQIAVEPEPFLKIYPEFVLPPEQMKAWLGRSAGRHRRRRSGASGSAGRSATACRSRARSGSRSSGQTLGVQHRRHLRRRAGRRQDAVLLPLRLPRREPAPAARAWSAGTS